MKEFRLRGRRTGRTIRIVVDGTGIGEVNIGGGVGFIVRGIVWVYEF